MKKKCYFIQSIPSMSLQCVTIILILTIGGILTKDIVGDFKDFLEQSQLLQLLTTE
jgi:hypothetical protein